MGLGKIGKGGKSRSMALKDIEKRVMTLKMKMKMKMRIRMRIRTSLSWLRRLESFSHIGKRIRTKLLRNLILLGRVIVKNPHLVP